MILLVSGITDIVQLEPRDADARPHRIANAHRPFLNGPTIAKKASNRPIGASQCLYPKKDAAPQASDKRRDRRLSCSYRNETDDYYRGKRIFSHWKSNRTQDL